jgi:hypothetical protein
MRYKKGATIMIMITPVINCDYLLKINNLDFALNFY